MISKLRQGTQRLRIFHVEYDAKFSLIAVLPNYRRQLSLLKSFTKKSLFEPYIDVGDGMSLT